MMSGTASTVAIKIDPNIFSGMIIFAKSSLGRHWTHIRELFKYSPGQVLWSVVNLDGSLHGEIQTFYLIPNNSVYRRSVNKVHTFC